jgi:hypothetical protein
MLNFVLKCFNAASYFSQNYYIYNPFALLNPYLPQFIGMFYSKKEESTTDKLRIYESKNM